MTSKLYKPLLIDSVKATVDIPSHRLVNFEGGVCTAGSKAYGVAEVKTDAEQYIPVGVLGTFLVEAGGTIAIGQKITSDANGKAVVATDSDEINGYALDTASAGEVIRVVRGI